LHILSTKTRTQTFDSPVPLRREGKHDARNGEQGANTRGHLKSRHYARTRARDRGESRCRMEMERARAPPSFIRDLLPVVRPSFLQSSSNLATIPSNSKAKDHGDHGACSATPYRQTRLADFDDPHAVATFERALLSRWARARHSSSWLSASNIPGARCHGSEIGLVTSAASFAHESAHESAQESARSGKRVCVHRAGKTA